MKYSPLLCFCVAGLLSLVLTSCDMLSDDSPPGLSVNNDLTSLNTRVQIVNEPIRLSIADGQDITDGEVPAKGGQLGEDTFIHVANVKAPLDPFDNPLRATSIEIRANVAYVSYHTNGSPFGGAIDMIDVSRHERPEILSSVRFDEIDVNALEIERNGKHLWFTGGKDIGDEDVPDGHTGSVVGRIYIKHKAFREDDYKEATLPSYSGNDIVELNDDLFIASGGSGGGFFEVDAQSLELKNAVYSDFAKSIELGRHDIFGLTLANGSRAAFYKLDDQPGQLQASDTQIEVTPIDGKNVIERYGDVLYASLGSAGIKGFRLEPSDFSTVFEFKASGNDAANGVTVDNKYIYVANGTDGLYVATRPGNGSTRPEFVFNWYGGEGSANYVKTDGQYVIVANGTDGLNILRRKTVEADRTTP